MPSAMERGLSLPGALRSWQIVESHYYLEVQTQLALSRYVFIVSRTRGDRYYIFLVGLPQHVARRALSAAANAELEPGLP